MDQEMVAAGVLIVTAALAILTGVYVWLTHRLLEAQTDPNVVLSVSDDEARPSVLILVVENIGRGMAYDVRFDLPEGFPYRAWGMEEKSAEPPKELKVGPLVNGIPALAPGGRRILTWGQYGGLKKAIGDRVLSVTVRFKKGTRDMSPVVCKLDIESFAGTDAVDRDGARQSAKALEKIGDTLARLERQWRTGTQ